MWKSATWIVHKLLCKCVAWLIHYTAITGYFVVWYASEYHNCPFFLLQDLHGLKSKILVFLRGAPTSPYWQKITNPLLISALILLQTQALGKVQVRVPQKKVKCPALKQFCFLLLL